MGSTTSLSQSVTSRPPLKKESARSARHERAPDNGKAPRRALQPAAMRQKTPRPSRALMLCGLDGFFRSSFLLRLGPKSLSSSNDLSKQGLHKLSSGRITRLVHSPALWPCVSDAHRHFLTGWVAIAHSQRKGETKRINMSARLFAQQLCHENIQVRVRNRLLFVHQSSIDVIRHAPASSRLVFAACIVRRRLGNTQEMSIRAISLFASLRSRARPRSASRRGLAQVQRQVQ